MMPKGIPKNKETAKKPGPKPSVGLSASEKAQIRLKCLSLVIENGSVVQARDPQERAEVFYQFIIGNTTGETNATITTSETPQAILEPAEDTVLKQVPTSPFGDSGNERVFIS